MLNIQVDYNTKLTSDKAGLNVMIEKRIYKDDETGIPEATDKWKVTGHYSNVTMACKGLMKQELNNSDATSFDELIADMDDALDKICKAVEKAGIKIK